MRVSNNSRFTNRSLWIRLTYVSIGVVALLLVSGSSLSAFAQSVEKSETSQQAKQQEDELQLAREAVSKPGEKPEAPKTGHIMGDYIINSSLELGYRSVDSNGNRNYFLSDVNVRDGFRLFDYSLDARSISGESPFFDFLRADVTNAGGDQSQYVSLRMDKTRAYKFDATMRRFNYFRSIATFALNEHSFDLRQQISDFNLKLFPQRAVRFNISYGRSMARGPFISTYDYQRDEFPIDGTSRWEANDYRFGTDMSFHGWDIFFEQMFRRFRNDTDEFTTSFQVGNQTVGPTVLSSFLRESPARSRASVTRLNIRGNITPNAHLVLRALYGDENLDVTQFEETTGVDFSGNTIVSSRILDTAKVHRPSTTADAIFTYDIGEHFSIGDTFRFTSYRIAGGVDTLAQSLLQPPNGPQQTPTSLVIGDEFTSLASYWNTFQVNFILGPKFSASGGLRSTHRDVTLRHFINPTVTEIEKQDDNTNTFIAALRFRPVKRVNFFFNYERGSADNAFVRIDPLDYQQIRVRSNVQVTDKLSLNASFVATDRTNPTRFVENDLNARAFAIAAFWQPNSRVWISGGYDYDYLFSTANIFFFINFAPKNGRSLYYARQNFVFTDARFAITKRLDALLCYRYTGDLGAPTQPLGTVGPNDFVVALPLTRHNPEARLAYRFNDHVTGNVTYRYYSYDERKGFIQDYRANILTTSVRLTF